MLWYQDTSPLCLSGHEPVCTGVHPYFWVGCVYFAVSVCWPHLKLLLLHVCFYAPMRTARRRNALYWLTFGGKYTLMDALSMVVLLGLYRIQIPIRFSDAFALLGGECKPICEALTNSTGDCTHACAAIEQATNHARLPKGTIDAQLAMEGLVAMVCFCCAVLLSILASVVVDSLEESQRLEHAQAQRRKSATAGAIDAAYAADDRIALKLGDAVGTTDVAAAEETDAAAHERRLRIAASFFGDANKLLASGVRGPTPSRGGSPIGSPLNSRLRGGSPNSHLTPNHTSHEPCVNSRLRLRGRTCCSNLHERRRRRRSSRSTDAGATAASTVGAFEPMGRDAVWQPISGCSSSKRPSRCVP